MDLVAQGIYSWNIGKEIGHGGNGIVYNASCFEHPIAAIKVVKNLKRDFFPRFETEIRVLQHCFGKKYIVPLLDHGYLGIEGDIYPFYVMPKYPGSLRSLIRKNPMGLGLKSCAQLYSEILSALVDLHEARLIHRDIKPENILIDEDGHVYLSDFGLARAVAEQGFAIAPPYMTQDLAKAAPAYYLSPEQYKYIFDKKVELDERSDIFQLGIVFYELMTGEIPIGQLRLPKEDGKRELFYHIIRPMLSQERELRPSTAKEILHTLLQIPLIIKNRQVALPHGTPLWILPKTIGVDKIVEMCIVSANRIVIYTCNERLQTRANPCPINCDATVYGIIHDTTQPCQPVGVWWIYGSYPNNKIVCSVFVKTSRNKRVWSGPYELLIPCAPSEWGHKFKWVANGTVEENKPPVIMIRSIHILNENRKIQWRVIASLSKRYNEYGFNTEDYYVFIYRKEGGHPFRADRIVGIKEADDRAPMAYYSGCAVDCTMTSFSVYPHKIDLRWDVLYVSGMDAGGPTLEFQDTWSEENNYESWPIGDIPVSIVGPKSPSVTMPGSKREFYIYAIDRNPDVETLIKENKMVISRVRVKDTSLNEIIHEKMINNKMGMSHAGLAAITEPNTRAIVATVTDKNLVWLLRSAHNRNSLQMLSVLWLS